MSAEPILAVRSDAAALGWVKDAVLFRRGVAIADLGSREVVLVDSLGQVTARQGGEGYGPEEYVSLTGVARHGEGLVAWDAYHFRFTFLDGAGKHVGEAAMHGEMPERHDPTLLGTFADHALVELRRPVILSGPPDPARAREDVHFLVVSLRTGEIVQRVIRPGEEWWAARLGPYATHFPIVFGHNILSAVAGRAWYLVDMGSLLLDRYEEDGAHSSVEFEHDPVPAEDVWVEAVIDSIRGEVNGRQLGPLEFSDGTVIDRRGVSSALLDAPLPARAHLPAVSALKGSPDGLLWIREFPLPTSDSVLWVALDEHLRMERRLRLSSDVHVMDFDEDLVLVLAESEAGAAMLEVYAALPPDQPSPDSQEAEASARE
ncbi:MAG: hypothetical protein WD960_01245 [Gemmatimonadota bacterium]